MLGALLVYNVQYLAAGGTAYIYLVYNTLAAGGYKQTPSNKSPPASETGKSPASIGIFSYM